MSFTTATTDKSRTLRPSDPTRIASVRPVSPGALRPDTIAIHGGVSDDPLTGAVVPPIYQTTTFSQETLGGTPPWCYSRSGNPTRSALESSLAALEGGTHAFAFASGLAAANALLQGVLSSGDHVVAGQDLYGGCWRLFRRVFERFGVSVSLIDAANPEALRAAITPRTRLLWLESPSNPLLRLVDLAAACAFARSKGILSVVDNTFATPILQRPLELGADIVLHSTTKYIGGHCDVLGGALVVDDPKLAEQLRFIQNATGAVPGPWDCFLLLRGIKTLPLRVRRHVENAEAVARFLDQHSAVRRTVWPGLPSHPQHQLAARQGFGSIVSFELAAPTRDAAQRFVSALRLVALAESLGGARSLLCHPATMTHASVDPAERARIGISDGLLRLSVGLEDPADLVDDLAWALRAADDESPGERHDHETVDVALRAEGAAR